LKNFFMGLVVGALIAGGVAYGLSSREVRFTTPFQAVLLDDNQVYYGRLSGFGTAHPVLTDVYYIKSAVDPQTKETKNVLVKRGNELHGPDRMYLNTQHIVVVESVGPASQVEKLITQSKNEEHK
jgi:hypothetical protein